jgi:sugar O-acyltransferase (sialic acid O-acetyltransferase NeuD family)
MLKGRKLKKKIVILGSGAQGKITADLCRDMGLALHGYLDDTKPQGSEVNGRAVLGGFSRAWDGSLKNEKAFTVAIGDPYIRTELFEKIVAAGGEAATIIHPNSFVSPSSIIGAGVVLSPFCYVKANAVIERYCLIEYGCSVGVNNVLGAGVFLGPSCHLNANCIIGEKAFLGTGTIVIPGKSIGSGAIVGAGSTVVTDIPQDKVAVGAPARVTRDRKSKP